MPGVVILSPVGHPTRTFYAVEFWFTSPESLHALEVQLSLSLH